MLPGSRNILLVEHEKDSLQEIGKNLKQFASLKVEIWHLNQFIQESETTPLTAFDGILLKFDSKDSQRWEIFSKIYSLASHIPIILITASDDANLSHEFFSRGGSGFLHINNLDEINFFATLQKSIDRKWNEDMLRFTSFRLRIMQILGI